MIKKKQVTEKTPAQAKPDTPAKKNDKEIFVQEKAVEQKRQADIAVPAESSETLTSASVEPSPKTIDYYLKKTNQWLTRQNPNFTIQLLLNPESFKYSVNDYLQTVSSIINPDDIHVYEAKIKGQTMYGVLYGNYPDKQSALQARSLLPEVITRNRPFVRTVNSLKRKLSNKLASNK